MTNAPTRFRRPFLFFAGLSLFFFLAFAGWSVAVFQGTALSALDLEAAEACAAHAPNNAALRMLMFVATSCGGVRANFMFALGGASWMWFHHRRRFAFAWLVIACIGGLLDLGLKDAFDRERPPIPIRDEATVHHTNPSYPSGHAMGSVIGYGMIGFVLMQRVKSVPRRLLIVVLLAAWVVLIGVSRVYLRAHWVSDVVGGWCLGLAYTTACLAIYFRRPSTV